MLNPESFSFLLIDFILIGFIFLYEMISLISSGPQQYLTSFNNLFDIIIIALCAVLNYFTYKIEGQDKNFDEEWLNMLQIVSLLVIYYRGLTYLRIFKWFRNVIDMLIGVTISTIAILIITALFIIAISVVFVKAHDSNYLI